MSAVKRGQGTGHRAQGTGHRAQGTGHRVQGTGHRAQGHRQGTGHGAQGTGTGHRAQGRGTGHRAQGTGPAEGSRAGRGQIVTPPPPECHGRDPPQNQMQRSCIRVWGFLRSGGLNQLD